MLLRSAVKATTTAPHRGRERQRNELKRCGGHNAGIILSIGGARFQKIRIQVQVEVVFSVCPSVRMLGN